MRAADTGDGLGPRGRRAPWWGLLLVAPLVVTACGAEADDLDEGPEPPEADTEIIPGEGGPVD